MDNNEVFFRLAFFLKLWPDAALIGSKIVVSDGREDPPYGIAEYMSFRFGDRIILDTVLEVLYIGTELETAVPIEQCVNTKSLILRYRIDQTGKQF